MSPFIYCKLHHFLLFAEAIDELNDYSGSTACYICKFIQNPFVLGHVITFWVQKKNVAWHVLII